MSEPKGRVGVWTLFVPTDPPQARGACDERRGKTPTVKGAGAVGGVPEASGEAQ
jgi:hypothetical protein